MDSNIFLKNDASIPNASGEEEGEIDKVAEDPGNKDTQTPVVLLHRAP